MSTGSGSARRRPTGCRGLRQIWNIETIYISENGTSADDKVAADGNIYDLDRIMYLRNYLAQLQRATSEGVPVRGYFLWSLMDNFEWIYGFEKRFGLDHAISRPNAVSRSSAHRSVSGRRRAKCNQAPERICRVGKSPDANASGGVPTSQHLQGGGHGARAPLPTLRRAEREGHRSQMTSSGNKPHIRNATEGDAAAMRAIARTAYAKYVPRIGREPSPMVATELMRSRSPRTVRSS